MGGKTGTTTQSVQIPPEVLARYNSVNAQAQSTAAQPFQQYSTNPNAFVAPLNEQQLAGISNVNQQATAAQPAYAAAMQGTANAYQGFNPQNFQQGVAGYMNPFVNQAMGATAAQLQNINQQQQNQLQGTAIQQGAFGGDRGNVAQAALINQQNLALGQTLSQMANQGYQSAAQNYLAGLGQQGALANQLGALGAGAQAAGLSGAQAQIGAGTLGQQTQQAGQTALYNQFLQQQAYPFQVAQFLANIAEGTGALSGSTTTTTQPMPFFSDRRLKENIKRVGTADNGLPIYKFKYKGDPAEQTHIGFMADEVEKVHPEAVGESHGYKTVDYDRAAKYRGGLVGDSEGGAVGPQNEGMGFTAGGPAYDFSYDPRYSPYDPDNIRNIIARQQAIYQNASSGQNAGRNISGTPGSASYVPQSQPQQYQLKTAGAPPANPQSTLSQIMNAANEAQEGADFFSKDKSGHKGLGAMALDAYKNWQEKQNNAGQMGRNPDAGYQARGGLVGYADGGDIPYEKDEDQKLDIPEENNKHGLVTASNPTGATSQSGLGLGQAAGLAKGLGTLGADVIGGTASLGTMGGDLLSILPFLSTGGVAGREHHDGSDGNVVGDSAPQDPSDEFVNRYWNRHLQQESGGKQFDASGAPLTSSKGAVGVSQIMPSTGPEAAKLAGVDWDENKFANDPEYNQTLGKAYLKSQYNKYHDPILASAAYNAGPGNVDAALAKASSQGGSYMDYLPPETQKYVSSIYGMKAPKSGGFSLGNLFGINEANAQEAQPQGSKNDNTDMLLSVLSGLGSMASSNSPYLGAALLQGLGGGAKTYAGLQKQKADIQATEAATKQTEFQTTRESFQQTPWGNIVWVTNPATGAIDFKPASQYNPSTDRLASPPQTGTYEIIRSRLGPPPATSAQPGLVPPPATQQQPSSDTIATNIKNQPIVGTPLPPPTGRDTSSLTDYYGPESAAAAARERQEKGAGAIEGGPSAGIPIEQSKNYITGVNSVGNASRDNQQNVHELASTLADTVGKTGWEAPGAGFFPRAQIAGVANTFLRAANQPEITDMDTDAQIIEKIRTLQGLARASGAGQESVRALDELANANANPSQSPKAYANLVAQLMVQTQRGIDQQNHANLFGRDSGNSYIDAGRVFEKENPAARYTQEANAIAKTMLAQPALFKDLISGKYTADQIDSAFEAQGLHGMSRYFLGGR
jgi:Transglycosylase SLT domain/Chaperone of endosialidase